jgi:hypothetical protein
MLVCAYLSGVLSLSQKAKMHQHSLFSSNVCAISETLVCVFLAGSFHANGWSLNCGLESPGQLAWEQAAYV